jgi:hypothetical protein
MTQSFADVMFTPSVQAVQSEMGSRGAYAAMEAEGARRFTLDEGAKSFIEARDHFFMATVSETGWPYVQHRGGPPGFVRVLDEGHFAFPDFRGNRQYVSVGNLGVNDRAAFIFMDFPNKARLKAVGHIRLVTADEDAALMEALALPGYRAAVERAFVVEVAALDWNCPQHITPRFSQAELEVALDPVRRRLAELEAENAALKAQLGR